MSIASNNDAGATLVFQALGAASGNGGAPVAITTDNFDHAPQGAQNYGTGILVLNLAVTLGVADTISFALQVQDADEDPLNPGTPLAFAAAEARYQPSAPAVITATTAMTAEPVAMRYDLRTHGLKKFVRYVITPTYSDPVAGNLFTGAAMVVLGGAARNIGQARDWTPSYLVC